MSGAETRQTEECRDPTPKRRRRGLHYDGGGGQRGLRRFFEASLAGWQRRYASDIRG